MYRAVVLFSVLSTAAAGCAGIGKRNVDFSKFQTAQSLRLDDTGRGTNRNIKRSATVTAPETIADVNALLRSVAANWKPVPWTPPYPQFTLSATTGGQATDWLWLDAPTGKARKAYVQMTLPRGGAYFTYISGADFDKLMRLFGVPEWRNGLDSQYSDGR